MPVRARVPSSASARMDELSQLPSEILEGILAHFCPPRDLARLLASSRGLRSFRRGCVSSLLEKLFEGKPSAGLVLPWIHRHYGDKLGGDGLSDIGLVDWVYGLRDVADTGAYRAALGEAHTVVVTPGGRALAAGSGRHGVLGASGNMNRFLFTEVDLRWGRSPGRVPVSAVACGDRHTLILTAVGTVHSCGLGDYGRLGHGDEQSLSRPTLIESLVGERITRIAGGQAHSVAVSWKGEAFTWGWGFKHALGHGDELDRLKPTRVVLPPAATAATATAATAAHHPSSVPGVLDDDGVTCADAGKCCTVLGTRRGRVLVAGEAGVTGEDGSVGEGVRAGSCGCLREFGRLPAGLRCWRVQVARLRDHHSAAEVAMVLLVIDSAGKIHEVSKSGDVFLRRRRWRCKRQDAAGGWGIECGGGGSGGSGGSGSSSCGSAGSGARSGGACEPPPSSTNPSPSPSWRTLRPAPPFAKCSSALVSPATEDAFFTWMEDGDPGWGGGESFVAVSADGHLLSSARTAEKREGELLRRKRGDGVVHASAWIETLVENSRGLLLVDGGASVVTHGNARTGHLGHGFPGYQCTPEKVTTAIILGGDARGGRIGGDHSKNVHISAADSLGLLALVDAAADERDLEEDGADDDDRPAGRAIQPSRAEPSRAEPKMRGGADGGSRGGGGGRRLG